MVKPGWRQHEEDVAEMFGLQQTIGSGNKFFDTGDAVTRGPSPFPLLVDAKYTSKARRSVSLQELHKLENEAIDQGKRMVLALRFEHGLSPAEDYVVLKAHDLMELLSLLEG